MEIEVLGTGSSGNCYRVNNGRSAFLLECGLSFKVIQEKLDFKISQLDFCIITHEHQDHSKACKGLLKSGLDLYMTKGTGEALGLSGHRVHVFGGKEVDGVRTYPSFEVGSYLIKPFMAIHDAKEPVGYLVKDLTDGQTLFFATDTAYLVYKIPKVDLLMVECNYVKERLDERVKEGALDVGLRNRIVRNHMGLEALVGALKVADLSACRRVYVIHLSEKNSDEALIKRTLQEVTGLEVVIA